MDLPIVAECSRSTKIATAVVVFIVCGDMSVVIYFRPTWSPPRCESGWRSDSTLAELPSGLYAGGSRGAGVRTAVIGRYRTIDDLRRWSIGIAKKWENDRRTTKIITTVYYIKWTRLFNRTAPDDIRDALREKKNQNRLPLNFLHMFYLW